MKEIECVVSGKVNGVGFREFVKRKASGLWLSGYAENAPDFSVRVVAQGAEDKLNKLVDELHKGPFMSKVGTVSVKEREAKEKYEGFVIKY